jgi:hypothetical protein
VWHEVASRERRERGSTVWKLACDRVAFAFDVESSRTRPAAQAGARCPACAERPDAGDGADALPPEAHATPERPVDTTV